MLQPEDCGPSFWLVLGSLFSQLYEWRSPASMSLDLGLVPSNCDLAICAPGDTYRSAQGSTARHGRVPEARGRLGRRLCEPLMEQHKFPAHLPFHLLLLDEIRVWHPGVESSKLDTLQAVTVLFYNNGAFTWCQALGLST